MYYLKFDKNQLINLQYSLDKEILRSNRAGSYASFTIVGCNTRKYHGLLVIPVKSFGGALHVLLSSLDKAVIQHDKEFRFGIHKYTGDLYEPGGHKYIRDFHADIIPVTIYRVGGAILQEETLLVERREQILVKYTLLDAHSETFLRFKPFLAFRNIHGLTKANMDAETRVQHIENGVKIRMYPGFPYLNMQFNKPADFVPVPHWYYNIEYLREQERGYDYQEDLFVPGYFEIPIKKGESIIFSGSAEEVNSSSFKRIFHYELSKRTPRNTFRNCLINSAQQFIKHHNGKTEIIAGFPWFGTWGRDTFISLPGLTLALGDVKTFKSVMRTEMFKMKNGLFPNIGSEADYVYNSVDAPLWFVWDVQQYISYTGDEFGAWKMYGKALKQILRAFRQGTAYNIRVDDKGLVYAGDREHALTWMDAITAEGPVTPRNGYAVEINALWYNAVKFILELAEKNSDKKFLQSWSIDPELIRSRFEEMFWSDEKEYLADYHDGDQADWSMRPNQAIAVSVPFSPLTDDMQKSVLQKVEKELLTRRGLRTLSPKNPDYKGVYFGNQETRDKAYHQGTVWPWLLGPYCEGMLKIFGIAALDEVKKLVWGFEEVMNQHGVGSISEIYDGDPPYTARGAISQAWSVAEILRLMDLIEKTEKKNSLGYATK
ncbi:MAG: amylo-alpha-1,6-glucosidase [Chlorobi bacterium]|nr:amylo-alpha-1,6-glucosidase [Chlorobiota bacterium]